MLDALHRIVRMRSLLALALSVAIGPEAAFSQTTTTQTLAPTHPAPVAKAVAGKGVAGVYDVRAFGAVGDGKTIDSPAINKAIETASAAGGGMVRFPAGTYLSYSIRLKSHITLYLDSGSKILAANKNIHGGEGFDPAEDIGDVARYQDFGHSHWRNSLIWGENVESVTITGPGMIDGGLYNAEGVNNPAPVPAAPRGGAPGAPGAAAPGGFGGRGTMGLSNGLGGGGGRGGRGGRGAARGAGATSATQPNAGRGAGGRGGRGGGGDPFAAALAALRNPAPVVAETARTTGTASATVNGGFGPGRRASGPFSTDLSIPYRANDTLANGVGNKAISLKLCKNITLSNFSMLRGGHFALLATGVDNFTIDNLKVDTNRDGFDIDGCRNVRISNCAINSPADDAIVLKSSWGLGFPRACENITIVNCLVAGGWEVGSMLDGTYVERNPGTGRIKFGTESNGGFKNIVISNCVFDRCQGLALEAVDGAVIDNVSISNITMREIGSLPIFIRLGDRRRMPADKTSVGAIRHVNISDIVAQNRAAQYACVISGIPGHEIEDLRISNVRIVWPGGAPEGIDQIVPPELEYQYPEPGMFGVMPAYGFFIRHVKGVALNNIQMTFNNKDMRPPFWLFDVKDAEFFNINAQREEGVPMFMLKDVEQFRARDVRGIEDAFKEEVAAGKI